MIVDAAGTCRGMVDEVSRIAGPVARRVHGRARWVAVLALVASGCSAPSRASSRTSATPRSPSASWTRPSTGSPGAARSADLERRGGRRADPGRHRRADRGREQDRRSPTASGTPCSRAASWRPLLNDARAKVLAYDVADQELVARKLGAEAYLAGPHQGAGDAQSAVRRARPGPEDDRQRPVRLARPAGRCPDPVAGEQPAGVVEPRSSGWSR